MADPVDKFSYQRMGIEMLRLARILPARDEHDNLALTIRYCDRADLPKYTALSYTWGTELYAKNITMNGKPYAIRRNLYNALLAVRVFRPDKWLWIDALCINQDDLEELNAQVRQMDTTFKDAIEVVTWLEGGAHSTGNVMAGRAVKSEEISSVYVGKGTRKVSPRPPWVYHQEGSGDTRRSPRVSESNDLRPLVSSLARRPYWRRMWIIQEITLARQVTLLWENGSMAFEDFRQNMRKSYFWNEFADSCSYLLPHQERIRYLKTAERSLFNMIVETRDCQCQDPRDRIFALLGVIDAQESRELGEKHKLPDYRLTYIEVVLKIIAHLKKKGEVRLFRGYAAEFFVALGVPEEEASLLATDIQLCKDVAMAAHRQDYDWKALAEKYNHHRGQDWYAFLSMQSSSGTSKKASIVGRISGLLMSHNWSTFNETWRDVIPVSAVPVMVSIWDGLYRDELPYADVWARREILAENNPHRYTHHANPAIRSVIPILDEDGGSTKMVITLPIQPPDLIGWTDLAGYVRPRTSITAANIRARNASHKFSSGSSSVAISNDRDRAKSHILSGLSRSRRNESITYGYPLPSDLSIPMQIGEKSDSGGLDAMLEQRERIGGDVPLSRRVLLPRTPHLA